MNVLSVFDMFFMPIRATNIDEIFELHTDEEKLRAHFHHFHLYQVAIYLIFAVHLIL